MQFPILVFSGFEKKKKKKSKYGTMTGALNGPGHHFSSYFFFFLMN